MEFTTKMDNYNIEENGEEYIIKLLSKKLDNSIIFDIGANKGEWSETVLKHIKNAKIYAFEPIENNYNELIKLNLPIKTNNIALGNKNETINMLDYIDDCTLASKYWFPHNLKCNTIPIKCIKGDDYCKENNINHIDFLKIDTEGSDFDILRGFNDLLISNDIDIIQFEYGYINIITGKTLYNFYQLLEHLGYIMGKLTPKGVNFKKYSFNDENWHAPNIIAVKKELIDIIDLIKIK